MGRSEARRIGFSCRAFEAKRSMRSRGASGGAESPRDHRDRRRVRAGVTVRRARRAALVFLALFAAEATLAHGPGGKTVVIPLKRTGKPAFLLPVTSTTHLLVPSVDFGLIPASQNATQTVRVENLSSVAVTVSAQASLHATVSPTSFTLGAAGTATAARDDIEVRFFSSQVGDFDEELSFTVMHTGVTTGHVEKSPVSAQVRGPSALSLSIVSTEGYTLSAGNTFDFGMVSLQSNSYADAPSFQLVITNQGELPVQDLYVAFVSGFGSIPPGGLVGTCDESDPPVTLCVFPGPNLGDLGPGASISTTWRVLPDAVGSMFETYEITAGQAQATSFTLAGEVIPFATLGEKFLTDEIAEAMLKAMPAQKAFQPVADPLQGNDPLGGLRVTSFDARTVFSVGDFDSVDLRAGNLTLMVPLDGPQQVRGPLSYELKAVYNSDLWHRRTVAEFRSSEGSPAGPIVETLSAEYPNPAFNLAGGWSLHLGRLLQSRGSFEVFHELTFCDSPLDAFSSYERDLDFGSGRLIYIDPNGTIHEFWRTLHGEEPRLAPGDPVPTVFYTRDGSFLRLVKESDTKFLLEQPDGIRRIFERQDPRQPTLPDEWLLTRIEDLYGNFVTIAYGPDSWTITDGGADERASWRTVLVSFADWPQRSGRPMIVDEVRLLGFAGATDRVYDFQYSASPLVLDRPATSTFHATVAGLCSPTLDTSVRIPRLDRIVLPNGSTEWSFAYTTGSGDDLRMTAARLPSGGQVEYEYAAVWESPPDCDGGSAAQRPAVSARRFRDLPAPEGDLLEQTRYLRQLVRTTDLPMNICADKPPGSPSRPWSEQVVAVWTDLQNPTASKNGLSRLGLHYFNLYSHGDSCPTASPDCVQTSTGKWRLASGRSHIERNVKRRFTLGAEWQDGDLSLSSRTYSCPFSIDHGTAPAVGWVGLHLDADDSVEDRAGDLFAGLVANCTLEESQWADYDVDRAGDCSAFTPHCLRDSRVASSKTFYHRDGLRWVRTDNDAYDGLGHYRATTTRSSLQNAAGPIVQTTFRNYHPDVGTLVLNSDHTVATNITPPAVWSLGHYEEHWVEEGGSYRGGEARFHPTLGHLIYDRTWTRTNCTPVPGSPGCRSAYDLVVRNSVDATTGELDLQRFFGADTFPDGTDPGTIPDLPVGDDWGDSGSFTGSQGDANQDYALDFNYQFGVLSEQRVVGETVHDTLREIDQSTGWTKSETLNSGEVLTFAYDEMGRMKWVTSPLTASHRFDYTQEASNGRWQLAETVYPKNTTATSLSPSAIRKYTARYDGLGRLRQEDLPLYDDNPNNAANRKIVTRTIDYHPSGQIFKLSPLDAPAGTPTRLFYDYRGRLLDRLNPDDSKSAFLYSGVRQTTAVFCVKTDSTAAMGICPNWLQRVTAVTRSDFRGRVVEAVAPEGFSTTFAYDPLGNQTSAVRSTQTRSWTYNGLGFQTSESIPERSGITFSAFNTRGQARTVTETGRTSALTYDASGRLTKLRVGSRDVKTFSYGTSGSENGRLKTAARLNYRDASTGGNPENASGAWRVASTFEYDSAGRPNKRTTAVSWQIGGVDESTVTQFDQSWTYDDFGNPKTITYPNCVPDCGSNRTVDFVYGQGFYLTGVTEGNLGATLTYHASGLVHRVNHANALVNGADIFGVASGMPRISSIDLANGSTNRLDLGTVGYDWAGNIGSIGTDSFEYDRNSRLTKATVRGSSTPFTYGYDVFDNHTLKGTIDTTNNRLTGGDWTYNSYGSLVQGGGNAWKYDELEKLITFDPAAGHTQLAVYDHDDLRVMRLDVPSGKTSWTLRDGPRVIREFEGNSPNIVVRKDYVYAGSRLISSQQSPPTGGILHYHEDQIGSARVTTGSSSKQIHYEPFGLDLPLDASGLPAPGSGSGERTVGFGGHENDGALTYMRGRSYLPFAARFLQVDPGGDLNAWSQYSYAVNNPIKMVDSTGAQSEEVQDVVDAAFVVLPFVPGVGTGVRAVIVTGDVANTLAPIAERKITESVEGNFDSGATLVMSGTAFQEAIAREEGVVANLEKELRELDGDEKSLSRSKDAQRNRMLRFAFGGDRMMATTQEEINARREKIKQQIGKKKSRIETLQRLKTEMEKRFIQALYIHFVELQPQ